MTWKQMLTNALEKRANRFKFELCRLCRMGRSVHTETGHKFVGG